MVEPITYHKPLPFFNEGDVEYLKGQWMSMHSEKTADLAAKYWERLD